MSSASSAAAVSASRRLRPFRAQHLVMRRPAGLDVGQLLQPALGRLELLYRQVGLQLRYEYLEQPTARALEPLFFVNGAGDRLERAGQDRISSALTGNRGAMAQHDVIAQAESVGG